MSYVKRNVPLTIGWNYIDNMCVYINIYTHAYSVFIYVRY